MFSAYAAVALAGIGDHLPDALASRSITIELDRARQGQVENTAWDIHEKEAKHLHQCIIDVLEDPEISIQLDDGFSQKSLGVDDLFGRDREVWIPLVSLAHLAGEQWHYKSLQAMQWFLDDAVEAASLKPKTARIQLLEDLLLVWQNEPHSPQGFVATRDLIAKLQVMNPEQWSFQSRYGELKPKRLSVFLNEYGIRPIKNHDSTVRGYAWSDFHDPWSRYLPDAWNDDT